MGKFDGGGAASGAVAGGAQGFAMGGPIGAGIGAITGGLLGGFGRSKNKPKKLPTLDKNQQGFYQNMSSGLRGEGEFADLFNFDADAARNNFTQMYAQPAYQNFQENIIPGITGQFRGQNIQNSSYLGGALSKAGSDVQKNLDAQLGNILYQGQQDSISRRIEGINNILNMQTFAYQKPQQSAGDQMFGQLMNSGGQALGNLAANKFGGGGSPGISGGTGRVA